MRTVGVEPHVTHYGPPEFPQKTGCFPLCETCWKQLEHPEARIEYYKALIDSWESDGNVVDELEKLRIQKSVANGG